MLTLTLNSGSSSLKYQLISMPTGETLARGLVERLGTDRASLRHEVPGMPVLTLNEPVPDYSTAAFLMLRTLIESGPLSSLNEVEAVGHRYVHGAMHSASQHITPDLLADLNACIALAPLHSPAHLAVIDACMNALPHCPHVCVFDNGFHGTLPPEVYTYALPLDLCAEHKIRRYGFHGLAFRSALERAQVLIDRPVNELKIVTLMLGSGNTANACDCGKSVEVSTGFTPHEGLVQSTRAGDMDAAIVPYLIEHAGMTATEVTDLINRKSGWAGISGKGQDLRDVIAAAENGDIASNLALQVTAHRTRKYIGAYAAAMGGIDLLIFAGSVGLKATVLRSLICDRLGFLGLQLCPELNQKTDEMVLSTPQSVAAIVAVDISEEHIIARDTWQVATQQIQSDVS